MSIVDRPSLDRQKWIDCYDDLYNAKRLEGWTEEAADFYAEQHVDAELRARILAETGWEPGEP